MPGPGLKGYQNQSGVAASGKGITATSTAPTTAPGLKPPPMRGMGAQMKGKGKPAPFAGVRRGFTK